ncbi:MAG: hypothetical protein ACYC0X_34960, partial [Pirellulaceae bacterium]
DRLQATLGNELEPAQEEDASRSWPPLPSPTEWSRLTFWVAAMAAGFAALWGALQVPVPIPDTHTRTGASSTAEVNDWVSAGSSFLTDRDGLYRIDVALSTLKRTNTMNVQFHVREEVKGPNLRTLRVPLDRLPEGKALDLYNTRWQDLPWLSFEFEPLYGHAGKPLYFNIEGKEIDRPNTVQVLFAYPNSYDRGEAHKSEDPVGANMIFRTYSKGTMAELLDMTFPLLASGRPGLLGQQWVYQGLAIASVALGILLFASIASLDTSLQSTQKPEAESTLRALLSIAPLLLVAIASWFAAGWVIDQTRASTSGANTPSDAQFKAVAVQPTASPSPIAPTMTPEPTTTAKLKPFPMAVANTSGQGVFISRSPSGRDRIKAWPERTMMMIIAPDQEVDGRKWSNVEDPDGNEGWVPAEYLVMPSLFSSTGHAGTRSPAATASASTAPTSGPVPTASAATTTPLRSGIEATPTAAPSPIVVRR